MRAAIIGLTGIATARTRAGLVGSLNHPMPGSHAAAYHATGAAEVVAVCDLSSPLVDRFHTEWGDVWPEARGYHDSAALFAKEKLDLVSVVTSDNAHAGIVEQAVAAGVRGIYCEKPIATSLADADRMIELTERARVPMVIEHTRRWWPLWVRARELVEAGEIGRLTRIAATLGGPRAMLFRNGTHLIDMIRYFAGSRAEWVVGALDAGFEDYSEYRGEGGRDAALDPGGSAIVQFRKGVRALISASKGTPFEFSMTLTGESGKIAINDVSAEIFQGDPLAARRIPRPSFQWEGISAGLMELVGLMKGERPETSPPREAHETLEMILAILESQRRGVCRVDLPLATKPFAS